ncbi:unnamed protein product [Rotaria magnacalcarata]|uniref:Helicase SKI2W n=2 Tax=Rotaria magnacalcarata TaxID=392030 RepID=A0A816PDS8_9BILA|nr:unnamed protein product [Rotaria magnacalcarata]
MTATKQFIRTDFDDILQSFVDENQFPWLDPSLHERQLTTHDIDVNRLFTIEALKDESDLVADRNLTTGEIIGLCEVPIIPKPVVNISLEDDTPLYPNEFLQPAPISCPCLPPSAKDAANDNSQDLETIINRNETDIILSTNDHLLKSLSNEDDLGMDLSSVTTSFKPNFDNQIETFLQKWKSNLDDINLQSTSNQQQSTIIDAPIPAKLRLGGLFDIPLPELKFKSTMKDINKTAEQQLNRSYAIELNPSEKLGDFRLRVPDMAIEYPFELDTFQKQAILRLENNESVFVAAHTSAGKTVVAEYAIALAQNHSTKAFYTSPIKALSNQKYCDFKKRFNDVGLLTGDVQINHEASCLIMTTEILRSMLYNRSNTLKSLEWVIMDEIHYLNDSERGFVWEEVLIMLPDHVGLIMLSATVSNAREFAEWVGRMKRRNVYVISTFKRPVPLEHFLYTGNSTSTNKELFMLIDAEQKFLERNHVQAVAAKTAKQKDRQQHFGSKTRHDTLNTNQNKTLWTSTIYMLRDKQLLPVVCFVFSRKRCDDYLELVKGLDLNTQEDKHYVAQFFRQALSRLNESDRQLQQVMNLQEMAKRGIAIHHSGVLPILRESVELLFQTGRIKVLFATETFAMGINMPARTVLFDSLQKHDGKGFRELVPSEYIQMAGRAGRRGLDKTGTVIALCKGDVPSIASLKAMILGKSAKLQSQFRLTYSMILNFLRVAECPLEYMVSSSYSEYHSQKANARDIIAANKLRSTIETVHQSMKSYYTNELKNYFNECEQFWDVLFQIQEILIHQEKISHRFLDDLLKCGRIIRIRDIYETDIPAIVLDGSFSSSGKNANHQRIISALVISQSGNRLLTDLDRLILKENEKMFILPVQKWSIDQNEQEQKLIYQIKNINITDLLDITNEMIPNINYNEILEGHWNHRMGDTFDIELESTMGTDKALKQAIEKLKSIRQKSNNQSIAPNRFILLNDLLNKASQSSLLNNLHELNVKLENENSLNLNEHFHYIRKLKFYENKYSEMNKRLTSLQTNLQTSAEYESMLEVLKELNYISNNNLLSLKGQVAAIFGSGKELLLTELIYQNLIDNLTSSEIAALLSSIIFQGKRYDDQFNDENKKKEITPTLHQAKQQLISIARRLDQIQRDYKVPTNIEDELNFSIMSLVYKWAQGAKFYDIMNDPEMEEIDVQEGTIVRTIMRIEELCSDIRNAGKTVGNSELVDKLNQVTALIKRGIVFAPSLYFSETITTL